MLMTFKRNIYTNPQWEAPNPKIGTFFSDRSLVQKGWDEVIVDEVTMTDDEAKQYCIDEYKKGVDVELVHDNLVWCNSWSYGLFYKE